MAATNSTRPSTKPALPKSTGSLHRCREKPSRWISVRDLNPSASSARCSSSHVARPPPASILRAPESPPSPTSSSRSHRSAFHWRSSSDRSHHCEFVGVEDFLGGEFPGKFGDLIKAFLDQFLAEDVVGQDGFHAAGDVEDVFGIHEHGGVVEDF